MKELNITYYPEKDYKELFVIMVDSHNCTDICVGITKEGSFLYIEEELRNSSNAYYMHRKFFSIDKDEFCHYLSIARTNGKIAKAIKNGYITEEELNNLIK